MSRTFMLLLAIAVTVVGCRSTTGRSTEQWLEDKALTARVKTALAATNIASLTRVDVDTYNARVYLGGEVESEQSKTRAEQVAQAVSGVRAVSNQLQVNVRMAPRSGLEPTDIAFRAAATVDTHPQK